MLLRYCSHIVSWLFDTVISVERDMCNGRTVKMTMNAEGLKKGNGQPILCHKDPGGE